MMGTRRPMTRTPSGNGRYYDSQGSSNGSTSDSEDSNGSVYNPRADSRIYLLNVRPENSRSTVSRYAHYTSGRTTFCNIISQLTEETQPCFETTLKARAVSEGSDAKFICMVSGYPEPEVTWYKDDEEMDRYCGLPKYEIFRNGKRHTLQIYKCSEEDAAIYQASARNNKGIVSCSGVLEVGTMTEYKIHQRWFAKLKRKAEAKMREIEQSRRRVKENFEEGERLRALSPERIQRKRRFSSEKKEDALSSSEDKQELIKVHIPDPNSRLQGEIPKTVEQPQNVVNGFAEMDTKPKEEVTTNGYSLPENIEENGKEFLAYVYETVEVITKKQASKESYARKKKKDDEPLPIPDSKKEEATQGSPNKMEGISPSTRRSRFGKDTSKSPVDKKMEVEISPVTTNKRFAVSTAPNKTGKSEVAKDTMKLKDGLVCHSRADESSIPKPVNLQTKGEIVFSLKDMYFEDLTQHINEEKSPPALLRDQKTKGDMQTPSVTHAKPSTEGHNKETPKAAPRRTREQRELSAGRRTSPITSVKSDAHTPGRVPNLCQTLPEVKLKSELPKLPAVERNSDSSVSVPVSNFPEQKVKEIKSTDQVYPVKVPDKASSDVTSAHGNKSISTNIEEAGRKPHEEQPLENNIMSPVDSSEEKTRTETLQKLQHLEVEYMALQKAYALLQQQLELSQNAEEMRAEAMKAEEQRAEAQKAEVQRAEAIKTEAHRAEKMKAKAQNEEAQRVGKMKEIAQGVEPQKAETKKAHAQKAEANKAEAQKEEAHRVGPMKEKTQRTEAQKAEAQKTDAQRTKAMKEEAQKSEEIKAEAQRGNTKIAEAQKAKLTKAVGQKAEIQRAQVIMAESQRPETPKAEIQKAEAQKADARRAEAQIADTQRTMVRKAEPQKAEATKAEAQRVGAMKQKAQKAEAQKEEAQRVGAMKLKAHRAEAQKAETHKAEFQKTDAQRTTAMMADAQKSQAMKAEIQREEAIMVVSQRTEVLKAETQKAQVMKAEAKRAQTQKAETQKSEAAKEEEMKKETQREKEMNIEKQKAELQKAEAQTAEPQKAEVQKADAQRTKAMKAETQKAEEMRAEAQKENTQRVGPMKAKTQRTETQKAEVQKEETQRAESRKAETQKAEVKKAETPKSEAQRAEEMKEETQRGKEMKAQNAEAQNVEAIKTETQKEAAQRVVPLKAKAQRAEAQKTDAQMTNAMKAEARKAETVNAEEQREEAIIAEAEMAEVQKAEVQKEETQRAQVMKAETLRTETQKSETKKAETPKSEAQRAEEMKEETQREKEMKGEAQMTETQKAEQQKAETQKAEAQRAEVQKADIQRTEAMKAEAQKKEAQRVGPMKAKAQRTEAQKPEEQKAEAQKPEAMKAEAQRAAVMTSEVQKAETQRAQAMKPEAQRTETLKAETQKSEAKNSETQKPEAQRAEEVKEETQREKEMKAEAQMAEAMKVETQKAEAQTTQSEKAKPQKAKIQEIHGPSENMESPVVKLIDSTETKIAKAQEIMEEKANLKCPNSPEPMHIETEEFSKPEETSALGAVTQDEQQEVHTQAVFQQKDINEKIKSESDVHLKEKQAVESDKGPLNVTVLPTEKSIGPSEAAGTWSNEVEMIEEEEKKLIAQQLLEGTSRGSLTATTNITEQVNKTSNLPTQEHIAETAENVQDANLPADSSTKLLPHEQNQSVVTLLRDVKKALDSAVTTKEESSVDPISLKVPEQAEDHYKDDLLQPLPQNVRHKESEQLETKSSTFKEKVPKTDLPPSESLSSHLEQEHVQENASKHQNKQDHSLVTTLKNSLLMLFHMKPTDIEEHKVETKSQRNLAESHQESSGDMYSPERSPPSSQNVYKSGKESDSPQSPESMHSASTSGKLTPSSEEDMVHSADSLTTSPTIPRRISDFSRKGEIAQVESAPLSPATPKRSSKGIREETFLTKEDLSFSPSTSRKIAAKIASGSNSIAALSVPSIVVGSLSSEKTPGDMLYESQRDSNRKWRSSENLSAIPSATPQELASGARRKIYLPKPKQLDDENDGNKESLTPPSKKESPNVSPGLSRKSSSLLVSQSPPVERRSPGTTRRMPMLDVPKICEEMVDEKKSTDSSSQETKDSSVLLKEEPQITEIKKIKDPYKAPQVIRKIRAEQFSDASGNLKLWCQFFNILSDSDITWYKDEVQVAKVKRCSGDEGQVALAIVQASVKDCGVYQCTIENEYGTDSTDCLLSAEILAGFISREEVEVGEEIEMTPMVFAKGLADSGYWGDKFFGRIAMEEPHAGNGFLRKSCRVKVIYGLEPMFESGKTCIIKIRNLITFGTKNENTLVEKNYDITIQECKIQNTTREYCKIFAAECRGVPNFGQILELLPLNLIYRPANNIPYATIEDDLEGAFEKYCVRDITGKLHFKNSSEIEQKCCTFQHWVYQWTNGNFLVTTLEGVGWKLTNIAIATKSRGYQGLKESCYPEILEEFPSIHQCNMYCEMLSLKSLKTMESLQPPTKPKGSRSPQMQRKSGSGSAQSSPQIQKKTLTTPQNNKKGGVSPKSPRKSMETGEPQPGAKNKGNDTKLQ